MEYNRTNPDHALGNRPRGVSKKTTLLRDFVVKIAHVVSLSEILSAWMEKSAAPADIDRLKGKVSNIESAVQNVMLKDSISEAMSQFTQPASVAIASINEGFVKFLKFRASITNRDSNVSKWIQIQRTLEEAHGRYNTIISSRHSSMPMYSAGNRPYDRKYEQEQQMNVVRRNLTGIITVVGNTLKDMKAIDTDGQIVKSELIGEGISKHGNIIQDVLNSNSWEQLWVTIDEILPIIDKYVGEVSERGKVLNDIFDIRGNSLPGPGGSRSTVNAKAYLEFLSNPKFQTITETYNAPIEIQISTDLFKQLTLEEFLGYVTGALDEKAGEIRKQLQKKLDSLSDAAIKVTGKGSGGSNPSNETVTIKAVISNLDSLEHISMNIDSTEVIRILGTFLAGLRGKDGVMDNMSIVTREDDGNIKMNSFSASGKTRNREPPRPGSFAWRRSGILFRTIDTQVLNHFVQQIKSFRQRVEEASLNTFISAARANLIQKMANLDLYYLDTVKQTDANKVLVKQSTRKLKMNAFMSYVKTIRGLIKRFVRTNVSFVTEQHRNAYEYVSYWNARAEGTSDVRMVNNECRALLKEYFNTRDSIVSFVNELIMDETIRDVRSALTTVGMSGLHLDTSQERALVDTFDRLVMWIDQRGQIVSNMHLQGKQPLGEIVMSQIFIMAYGMKGLRFAIAWYALRVAGKYFQKMYDARVYAYEQDPPSVWKFIGIFVLVDIVMNSVIFGVLQVANMLLSDTSSPLVDPIIMKALVVDYVLVTGVVLALAGVIGNIVKNKKYFRYKYEGDRGIRAMQTMIMNVYGVIILVPFFRVIAG